MPKTPLSLGAEGNSVAQLQKLLQQWGFQLDASEVKWAFFGPTTRQAVQQFQQQQHLPISGMLDEQTEALLQQRHDHQQPTGEQPVPDSAPPDTQTPQESSTQKTPESPTSPTQPEVSGVLSNATRYIEKATLVPLQVGRAFDEHGRGLALTKNAFVRQLSLQPGEVMAVQQQLGISRQATPRSVQGSRSENLWDLLTAFERPSMPSLLPSPSTFTDVPITFLQTFGTALAQVRQQALNREQQHPTSTSDVQQTLARSATHASIVSAATGEQLYSLHLATIANKNLEAITSGQSTPIGMLNLERLEMTPAGIQRGELIATIPLAPLEETAVTHKEWSVTSKEFTSIVTDSLENVSETGVTDNTELAQSTTSQLQHNNQFNITGTVSGGIPSISGSTTTNFGAQDAASQSATDSRKHAVNITHKAASRSTQEHKITISTKTETGTSETTTRLLKNPSPTDPIRIDYFSFMRKWQVRLYRYGLRLTYDVVIPEPAGAMRETYARLDWLRSQIGPFDFPIKPSDITNNKFPGEDKPHYLVLADLYKVNVPTYPEPYAPLRPERTFNPDQGWTFTELSFDVPDNHVIESVLLSLQVADVAHINIDYDLLGSQTHEENHKGPATLRNELLMDISGKGQKFLAGGTKHQTVTLFTNKTSHLDPGWISLTVNLAPSPERIEQWRNDVWSALYNAAQTRYFTQQQNIQAQIVQLEEQLNNVDTLTLRREESDEIMKGVLRFLLGADFEFMPDDVLNALKKAGGDLNHGVAFTGNKLSTTSQSITSKMTGYDLTLVRQYEDVVRFINQAIEWENVATFLYSYFWDVPPSWEFIRQIRHSDPTRQAFLRAGSARVVLTIRKGWEQAWVNFQHTSDPNGSAGNSLYLPIAKEIAAYDDRNYPGIPPANPGKSAVRLEDAVYTTSASQLSPSNGPVTIEVESSAGIVPGLSIVIDSYEYPNPIQETQLVMDVPGPTQIVVQRLDYAHGRSGPFPIVQPGEKGVLIAEWNEYTPTSGVDIAVTSNLATMS